MHKNVTTGGVRTHADIHPLDLKSNALTTRPPWFTCLLNFFCTSRNCLFKTSKSVNLVGQRITVCLFLCITFATMWYIKCYLYYICDFYRCSTLSLPQLFFYLCRILFGSGAAQWILQGPYQHPKAKEFVKKVPITGFSVVSNLAINGILLYIAMKLFYWLLCFLFGSCISGN